MTILDHSVNVWKSCHMLWIQLFFSLNNNYVFLFVGQIFSYWYKSPLKSTSNLHACLHWDCQYFLKNQFTFFSVYQTLVFFRGVVETNEDGKTIKHSRLCRTAEFHLIEKRRSRWFFVVVKTTININLREAYLLF